MLQTNNCFDIILQLDLNDSFKIDHFSLELVKPIAIKSMKKTYITLNKGEVPSKRDLDAILN